MTPPQSRYYDEDAGGGGGGDASEATLLEIRNNQTDGDQATHLLDTSDVVIDPATTQGQAAIIAALGGLATEATLAGIDFATETTLALILTALGNPAQTGEAAAATAGLATEATLTAVDQGVADVESAVSAVELAVDGTTASVASLELTMGSPAQAGEAAAATDGLNLEVTQLDVKRGITDYRVLMDYGARLDTNPVYVGKNGQSADPADNDWTIQRLTYDLLARVTDVQVLVGVWDDRAILPWT